MSGYHPSHRPGSRPTFTSSPDRTIDVGYVHVGRNVMPGGEWECADNCPHPDHDHEEATDGRR